MKHYPPSPENGEEPEDDESDDAVEESTAATEEPAVNSEPSVDEEDEEEEEEEDADGAGDYVIQHRDHVADDLADAAESSSNDRAADDAEDVVLRQTVLEPSAVQAKKKATGVFAVEDVFSDT